MGEVTLSDAGCDEQLPADLIRGQLESCYHIYYGRPRAACEQRLRLLCALPPSQDPAIYAMPRAPYA